MLRSWLRLLRVGTLLSPAADVVAGACVVALPWSAALGRAMLASVLVYAAGMVLNDHADRAEDARQRPERPIPSGAIRPATALAVGLSLLCGGVAISPWWPWHAGLAIGVLAYDYVLKPRAPLAVAGMGLLRGGNLLAGAATVTRSVPDSDLLVGIALAYAAYIAAVTVLGIYEDQPRVRPRAVIGAQAVPPVVTLFVLLALPERWPALAIGAVLIAAFAGRVRRQGPTWDRGAIRRSMTWLLLGTMLFAALVCLGSGRPLEAAGVACAVPFARWISRHVALT